jgi:predicted HAD superfamily hydrolase
MKQSSLNKILRKQRLDLSKISIIAFDVFDTLLHRSTSIMDPHYLWAKKLNEEFNTNFSNDQIVDLKFKLAKNIKLKNIIKGYDREYCYKELIKKLNQKLNININDDELFKFCCNLEIEIETKNTYIPQYIYEWIRDIEEKKIKIILISDYFLPSFTLKKILANKNLNIDEVYSSSDFLLQKKTGRLYKKILDKQTIDPSNILMIGDNYTSDYLMPRKYGINSLLFDKRGEVKLSTPSNILRKKDWLRFINSKDIKNGELAFSRVAFLMFDFINQLSEKLIRDERSYALFMSREGEFFKKLFDSYQNIFYPGSPNKIKSHYFYISRRSSLLPAVHTIDKSSFEEIYKNYPNISINTFLKNLQLDKNEEILGELKDKFNLANVIDDFENSKQYEHILSSNIFRAECLKAAENQRDLLENYIESFGSNCMNEGLNIVDVGYAGTAQNNLHRMYNRKQKINGYYMFCYNEAASENNLKHGILQHGAKFSENIYTYNSAVIEMLCLASHGSANSYEQIDSNTMAVLEKNPLEIFSYEDNVCHIQNSILEVFNKIAIFHAKLELGSKDTSKKYKNLYKRFIFNPTDEEILKFIEIPFYDNFASYKSYLDQGNDYKGKWLSLSGLKLLFSSKFKAIKDQNVHWIAAASYKMDMRILNPLMLIFNNATAKLFLYMQKRANKKKEELK